MSVLPAALLKKESHLVGQELLEEHDRFWSQQRLEEDWWDRDSASELTQQRQRRYDEVRSSIATLGKLGDDGTIDAINQTKTRWLRIDDARSREIVKQCDEALRLIDERNHAAEK